jgi:dolichyldiphosphatase
MWAGQLLCEAFNWILKRAIKQERPSGSVCLSLPALASTDLMIDLDSGVNGYGFPSSHSQVYTSVKFSNLYPY